MARNAPALPPEAALPPCDERIVKFYDYWLAMHPARSVLPGRQHFDPARVPALLPWLWLIDFQRDPLRFKYRLIGTGHVRELGFDPTARWLDEVHPRFATSSSYDQFIATVDRAEIGFYRGSPGFYTKRDYMAAERLLLPLARNGADVDLLLGITVTMHKQPKGSSLESRHRL